MANVIIALLIAAFVALLFSRIHFHFSFNLTISRQAGIDTQRSTSGKQRRARYAFPPVAPSPVAIRPSQEESELASALINLGCEKKKATDVARSAMFHGQDFETRMKWAMQNAA